MSDIAVHPATIVSLTQDCAVVEMYVSSACATCEGHDQCGFAEGSVKQVVVPLSSPAVFKFNSLFNLFRSVDLPAPD